MSWAVKLSITERIVTVAERAPAGFEGRPRSPERAAAGTRPEQRRRCAVIIDRDPDVVSGLSALLSPHLDVQSAVSPSSAALLLDQLEHVDLAFVELELPDSAGEQLLQQLGRWPDAIRVLLTQPSLADEPSRNTASLRPFVERTVNQRTVNQRTMNQRPVQQRPSALAASELLRNAYLAHLVLIKPVSEQVVRALQRATLGLLRV